MSLLTSKTITEDAMIAVNVTGSALVCFVLSLGCLLLILNIVSIRNANLELRTSIELTRTKVRIAMDKNQDCNDLLVHYRNTINTQALQEEFQKVKEEISGLEKTKEGLQDTINKLQLQLGR